jgi:polysaccharide chain length determinant protein (PEP-CTERM system associated)
MSPRIYTPDEVIRVVKQRRWFVLIPFAIGVALAPFLARFAPEQYRSETLIMVVPQRVPDDYVKPTVTQSVADRLPAITDQILSRSRLERIIEEMNLYPEERKRMVMEDVVAQMRRDVGVQVEGRDADSFRVSFVSSDPETAQRVAERLASLYIEQNLTDRSAQAESTSQFLDSQLEQAKQRLMAQEKKLEEYRLRHAGELPSQMQSNLQVIQGATMQLSSLNDAINRAQERRLLIERQLAEVQATPVASSVPNSNEVRLTPQQQLEFARARMAALLQRYTPNHPEVVSLERTIEELVAKIGEETPLSASAPPLSPAEAAQRKRIADLEAELAIIDRQLETHREEEKRLRARIAEYQAKVDAAPTRESELVELTRDYSTLQTAYANLLMKREQSMIAANLERRQIGEQFRILDPAARPQRPFNQAQRLGVMSSGALAGVVLGLLIIALLELRDTSFRRQEEVHQVLNLPVLALIPVIASERELENERRRMLRHDLAGGAVLLMAVAIVVIWQLRF